MGRIPYISGSVSVPHFIFSGGLNSTAGALSLQDTEASDLQNVDFDVFGSVKKRNGYTALNTTVLASGTTGNGMAWYKTPNAEYPILVASGEIYKMDELDGIWDEITGGVKVGALDSSTKLLLHCDGANASTAFVDAVGKTVTNTPTYDSYTKLMLHFEGADGTTGFTDDIGKTVTANGNAQLDTAQSKFGSASGLFDGTGDYLSTPDHADWDFAAGNFTIDFWVRFNVVNVTQGLISQYATGATTWLVIFSLGEPSLKFYYDDGVIQNVWRSWSPSINTWYHIAIVRNGNNLMMFVDGTQLGTNIDVTGVTIQPGSAKLNIGSYNDGSEPLNGWLDEIRISKNIARWTTNFTVPSYSYGTAVNSTSQQKFDAGSGYFDGNGSNLSLADHADWSFGAGNFTVDFWTRFATINSAQVFCGQYSDGNNYWFTQIDANNKLQMKFVSTSTTQGDYVMTNAWSGLATNSWYHIAAVRSSSVGLIFVNGTSQAVTQSTAFSTNNVGDIGTNLVIGLQTSGSYFNGYLDEFRISKGTARWVANFTSPTKAYARSAALQSDFETFVGYVLGTDGESTPWQWLATNSTASTMTVPAGLTTAKFVKKFQNYCFFANVTVSSIKYSSRFYWSTIKSISSWAAADFIEVSPDDGEEITGFKTLGDRLVCYKTNSIYLIFFTGDADIPFIVQKANSHVGCIAPYSIQEVNNGHIFLAYDGLYYFDGNNSYKMSDRLNSTIRNYQTTRFPNAISMYQKTKNRYWLAISSASTTINDKVIAYDSLNNAFSIYHNMYPSAMSILLVNGVEERPYFFDYLGYAYRADIGNDDYPSNSKTAINAYYYTGWKKYEDICSQKAVPHTYIYHSNTNATLTFAYSYDYSTVDDYTTTFSTNSTGSVNGLITRRDLDGRGRLIRFKFANARTSETFQIDGIGAMVKLETDV